jgi:hypothetical protein
VGSDPQSRRAVCKAEKRREQIRKVNFAEQIKGKGACLLKSLARNTASRGAVRGEEGSLFRLTIELEATQRGNGVAEVAENEDCVTERREMAREAAAQAQVATDGL